MGIQFMLLLLFPLVVCTGSLGYPFKIPPPPYVARLGVLTNGITGFIIYTYSLNYDAFFFTPALMFPVEREVMKKEFLDFFAKDFSLSEHARDFQFSETENLKQFAKRFFRYVAEAENVPSKIREIAANITMSLGISHDRDITSDVVGFIRPCPLYSFVRALTLFEEAIKFDEMGDEIGMNNVEVLIKFLLTEFDPKDYHIEDKAYVTDILAFIKHAYDMSSGPGYGPLKLTDGSIASQRNKQLLQRLLVEEAVPQNVKDAITAILPHM